jgi:5'-AMP-activated protein kinase, catalytic alpha subunit
MAGIKAHEWFRQGYTPAVAYDSEDEDSLLPDAVLPVKEVRKGCLKKV